MSLVTRYGGILLLIASAVISVAILIDAFTGFGTVSVAINYCKAAGFKYEERAFQNILRGYCIFSEANCSMHVSCEKGINCIEGGETVSAVSECPVVDFYKGACMPCDYHVFNCSIFEGREFCTQELVPVCARVRIGVTAPYSIEERRWGNACSACINSKETEFVTGYTNRTC